MRRTLLFIPHEIAGIPVFGIGWILIALLALLAFRLLLMWRRKGDFTEWLGELPFWLLAVAAVVWLMPNVELKNVDGEPVGMAIRGYGVLLLAGVGSAVGLASWRARARGISPDLIVSMAPWVFVGGIVGARTFYVIQYRERFIGDTWGETIRNMLAFTEGGLVVYGSIIGGFIAGVWFIYRHKLPLLKMGDIIVPCIFLGIFLGRIGCLMNGCCYGGRCEDTGYALHFPAGSPVYMDQLKSGELLGLSIDPLTRKVIKVEPNSLAANKGITVGGRVDRIDETFPEIETVDRSIPVESVKLGAAAIVDGKIYRWSPTEMPMRALAVQPAQGIASIGALILCLALCAIPRERHREGMVMMLGFAAYAVLRFILEWIRVDEAGQFGTSLSIAQWISIVVLTASFAGLAWIYWTPQAMTTSNKPS